jgi:hypothetical protein
VQLEKELLRLQELFALNDGNNSLVGGHVAFPSLTDREKWLKKHGLALVTDPRLRYEIKTSKQITGDEPEDGIPVYFANCISVYRI